MNPNLHNETDTTQPASPNSELMDDKIMVNLFSMGEVIHIAVNLLLQRRPQIEHQLDQVTYGDIRKKHFYVISETIAEAIFCDSVENQLALDLARRLCVVFLAIEHDRRISIIKEVRHITGRNLKDSKMLVDRIFDQNIFPSLPDIFGKADRLITQLSQCQATLQDLRAESQRLRAQRDDLENALADERAYRVRLAKIADARYDQVSGLEGLIKFAQGQLPEALVPIFEGGLKALEDAFNKASC